jgi:hypothetical protein
MASIVEVTCWLCIGSWPSAGSQPRVRDACLSPWFPVDAVNMAAASLPA